MIWCIVLRESELEIILRLEFVVVMTGTRCTAEWYLVQGFAFQRSR